MSDEFIRSLPKVPPADPTVPKKNISEEINRRMVARGMTPPSSDPPPHDLALEHCVLATILYTPKRCGLLLDNLREEYFYDGRCRAAWKEIHKMHLAGEPIDSLLLADRLKGHKLFPQDDSHAWVFCELYDNQHIDVPSSGYMRLRQMDRSYRMRLRLQMAQRVQSDPGADVSELMAELNAPVRTFTEDDQGRIGEEHVARIGANYERAEALRKRGRYFAGIDCGFPAINDKLNGLMPGELTVLAARPSIGKSTLALQIALNAFLKDRVKVGIVTLEMHEDQIVQRMAAIMTGLSSLDANRGALSPANKKRFLDATNTLSSYSISIFAQAHTAAEICGLAAANPQIDLWIVDHLHRIRGHETEERHRLGNAAESLANLSIRINKHVLLLAQLNRDCEDRPGKRPNLSDLKSSGTIEEVAANVCLIHRPGFYDDMRQNAELNGKLDSLLSEVTILVEKCRFGVPGSAPLAWVPEQGIFASHAPEYRQERYVAWNPIGDEEEGAPWNN